MSTGHLRVRDEFRRSEFWRPYEICAFAACLMLDNTSAVPVWIRAA